MSNLLKYYSLTIEEIKKYTLLIDIIKTIGIIVAAYFAVRFGSFLINKLFEKQKKLKMNIIDERKIQTMASLTRSFYKYAIYLIAIVMILSDVFNMKSILAAAGVGGVAIGFGAQSLIKDVISGFFIVLEDQYSVGDLITLDNLSGTVENLELRVTKLRNFNGDLYIIPNGEIKKVINHSRGNKAVIVDIPISYSADVGKAMELASKVCEEVNEKFDTVVEPAKVLGITEMSKDSLTLRVVAKTKPNEQWEVERYIRKLIKEKFDQYNITFFEGHKIILKDDDKGV